MKSLKHLNVAINNSASNYGNKIYYCVLKKLSFS